MTGETQHVSLLFAAALLVWHAANYLFRIGPTRSRRRHTHPRSAGRRLAWLILRSVIAATLAAALTVRGTRLPLAAAMFAACIIVPLARWRWVPGRYLAEFEIGVNLAFAALIQLLIMHFDLQLAWRLPPSLPEARAAAYTVAAALMIFVVRGGTLIVRGVLDRAGTMPPPELGPTVGLFPPIAPELQHALPVDTVELNHGRLIGNIERLILVLFVAQGQYTALAFFFAAKGLIRSKDIERRAWADYLILGSLTSFLVAVVAGLLIQAAFRGV
jgi:hypothetical protein